MKCFNYLLALQHQKEISITRSEQISFQQNNKLVQWFCSNIYWEKGGLEYGVFTLEVNTVHSLYPHRVDLNGLEGVFIYPHALDKHKATYTSKNRTHKWFPDQGKSNIFRMRNIHLFENRLELTANLLATLVAQISCKNATGIYHPNHYHQKLSNTILRCGPRLYRKWNLGSHCFRWELAQHAWKKVGRGIKNALCS